VVFDIGCLAGFYSTLSPVEGVEDTVAGHRVITGHGMVSILTVLILFGYRLS
jgi:hypothetical protein